MLQCPSVHPPHCRICSIIQQKQTSCGFIKDSRPSFNTPKVVWNFDWGATQRGAKQGRDGRNCSYIDIAYITLHVRNGVSYSAKVTIECEYEVTCLYNAVISHEVE